jgi:hypothetical protein
MAPPREESSGADERFDVLQYDLPDDVDPEEVGFEQETYAVPAGTGERIVSDHQSVLSRHGWVLTGGVMVLSAVVMAGAVYLNLVLIGILLVGVIVVFDRVFRPMIPTPVAPEIVAAAVDRRTAVEEYGAEMAEGDPFLGE